MLNLTLLCTEGGEVPVWQFPATTAQPPRPQFTPYPGGSPDPVVLIWGRLPWKGERDKIRNPPPSLHAAHWAATRIPEVLGEQIHFSCVPRPSLEHIV